MRATICKLSAVICSLLVLVMISLCVFPVSSSINILAKGIILNVSTGETDTAVIQLIGKKQNYLLELLHSDVLDISVSGVDSCGISGIKADGEIWGSGDSDNILFTHAEYSNVAGTIKSTYLYYDDT